MPKSYDGNIENIPLNRSMDAKLIDFGKCVEDEASQICTWIKDFVKLAHQAKRNEMNGMINKDLIVNTPALHKRKKPVSQLADDITRRVLFDSSSENDVATTSSRVKKDNELKFDENLCPPIEECIEQLTNKMIRISKKLSIKSQIPMENSDTNSKQGCKRIIENHENVPVRQTSRNTTNNGSLTVKIEQIDTVDKIPVRRSRRNQKKENSLTVKVEQIANHETTPIRRRSRRNTKNNDILISEENKPVRQSRRIRNKGNSPTSLVDQQSYDLTTNENEEDFERVPPASKRTRKSKPKSEQPSLGVDNRTTNTSSNHLDDREPPHPPPMASRQSTSSVAAALLVVGTPPVRPPRKNKSKAPSSPFVVQAPSSSGSMGHRNASGSTAIGFNERRLSTDDEFLSANEASPPATATSVRSKKFTKKMKKKPTQPTPPPPPPQQRRDPPDLFIPNVNAFITDEGCHATSTPVKRPGSIQYVPSYTPKRVHRMSTGGANNPVAFDAPIYTGLGNKHKVISMGPPALPPPPTPDHKRNHSPCNPRSLDYGVADKITRVSTPRPAVVATSRAPSGSGARRSDIGARRSDSGARRSGARRSDIGARRSDSGARRSGARRSDIGARRSDSGARRSGARRSGSIASLSEVSPSGAKHSASEVSTSRVMRSGSIAGPSGVSPSGAKHSASEVSTSRVMRSGSIAGPSGVSPSGAKHSASEVSTSRVMRSGSIAGPSGVSPSGAKHSASEVSTSRVMRSGSIAGPSEVSPSGAKHSASEVSTSRVMRSGSIAGPSGVSPSRVSRSASIVSPSGAKHSASIAGPSGVSPSRVSRSASIVSPSGAKHSASIAGPSGVSPSRVSRSASIVSPSGAKHSASIAGPSGVSPSASIVSIAGPSGSRAIQIISCNDEPTTNLMPVRRQPESDISSDESMVEIRSESPFNKHRSITGFQGLSVKEKARAMQQALNGDSPKVLIPRSKVRRSTRKSHIIRKSIVKPRGPISKRIEAILQMKQKIMPPRMKTRNNEQNIEPMLCTPLHRVTPIVKKKIGLSSIRIKTKLAMPGSSKPTTPKPLSKAEMRNNELMKLKQEENDTRIRNLQLKRLQIAEEHKKVREVKAKEVATRREIQSSQMKVKRVLSVRKKNEATSLLESRAAMLQERSRADREVRQKKSEEIESKRRLDDEILRRKKKMDIEIEKRKNDEMRRLKNAKADKDRQKRVEISILDARLRELKINEENLRIATESRIAGEKIKRDLEENRLKKLKEKEKLQERAKMRAAVQEMGNVNTLMSRIKDDSLLEDITSPPAAAASVSCYPSKSIFKQIKSPNMAETPEKPHKGAQTYDIDNLNEDSTDDECNPKNEIPEWADFAKVKEQVRKFAIDIPCIHKMFCPIPKPDINEIFGRKQYKPRTSSACWTPPKP